ncbi:MAG: SDR family oxidoreductase, partial [Myxococcales bacterium]|nr:SDR family oxidoreductase [Myxococcales bacterium]
MGVEFKRAIVVGASSGIGAAIAKALAEQGCQVAVLARRGDKLSRVAAASPERILSYEHDVEDTDSVPELFERIVGHLGGLDTIVYAAGVMPSFEEGEYNFEKDREMIAVNLVGAMAWLNPAAAR